MKILLISTYELGRQPFGLASPAAWLRKRGHAVSCLDLSREQLDEQAVREAGLVAFYVPMHTATRLTVELLDSVRALNPQAHLCAYGLYASLSADVLRAHGIASLLGGEFEQPLVDLAEHLSGLSAFPQTHILDSNVSRSRLRFQVPDRSGLPPLPSYAHLVLPSGEHRVVGYTEASRGCKHLCRHCPVVPVYEGVFRIVDREVVLADIRQQVAAGARHITFGDPDFFNGVGHAIPVVEALHREFPEVSYDATIKVEHLLQNAELLATLRDTNCLFIVSAVESLDDVVLKKLDKSHTRPDFFRAVDLCRRAGITLQPTFIPFTPWTTFEQLLDLFEQLAQLDLVEAVGPIQLAIRLLIPAGSRLLELQEVREMVGPFDGKLLVYPWKNANPALDALCDRLQDMVASSEKLKSRRSDTFEKMWKTVTEAANRQRQALPLLAPRSTVPYLNEPWYC
ncbi:MAG TPA: CUAEP/CCAEP-tail radical SAM protein [Candidatus Eremiobacteraceae bacterium]|nr:CUAEP/CCAEP-tail radical SAM protein [Candidatus Eremiobacteraceae bacterium]